MPSHPKKLKLVVVNDRVADSSGKERVSDEQPPSPKTGKRPFDPRFFDLAAIALAIGLAVFMAYVFTSLNHADRALLCYLNGGRVCN